MLEVVVIPKLLLMLIILFQASSDFPCTVNHLLAISLANIYMEKDGVGVVLH